MPNYTVFNCLSIRIPVKKYDYIPAARHRRLMKYEMAPGRCAFNDYEIIIIIFFFFL